MALCSLVQASIAKDGTAGSTFLYAIPLSSLWKFWIIQVTTLYNVAHICQNLCVFNNKMTRRSGTPSNKYTNKVLCTIFRIWCWFLSIMISLFLILFLHTHDHDREIVLNPLLLRLICGRKMLGKIYLFCEIMFVNTMTGVVGF